MWTSELSSAWLAGFGVCLSLIISIGAQNIYVLKQAVQGQHVRLCVAWCVLSDAVLIGLGVMGMAQLLASQPQWAHWLGWGGVVFLAVYGLMALRRVVQASASGVAPGAEGLPRSSWAVLGALAAITLLNPHVYLDTMVLMGSVGARQAGALKWVFVLGSASASLAWFVGLACAARRLRHVFARPLAWRVLDGITALMMLTLAVWVAQGIAA